MDTTSPANAEQEIVDYLLIGGIAALLHGLQRPTVDHDISPPKPTTPSLGG